MFKKGLFLGLALTMVCLVNTTVFCDVTKANLYIELSNPTTELSGKTVFAYTVKLIGGGDISVNFPERHPNTTSATNLPNRDVYTVSKTGLSADWAKVRKILVFYKDVEIAHVNVTGLPVKGGDVDIYLDIDMPK